MGAPEASEPKAKNSFTYAQRAKLKKKASGEQPNLKPTSLDPDYMEGIRGKTNGFVCAERRRVADEAWMRKLRQGDYEGPVLDKSCYLGMRSVKVEGNPRQTDEYRALC